jgi:hypothetical protein
MAIESSVLTVLATIASRQTLTHGNKLKTDSKLIKIISAQVKQVGVRFDNYSSRQIGGVDVPHRIGRVLRFSKVV